MSLTVIQRFYELAKQEADAFALGVEYEGTYHNLPWWFVKSKAKHFGLGLCEEGAREGEFFYLFPSSHPQWIYAELGALTFGLQTLPLPPHLSELQIMELFKNHPPAFIYLGEEGEKFLNAEWFHPKSLHRIITERDPPELTATPREGPRSFRQVFNSGIRHETKFHAPYRKIRQSLVETNIMSPIRVEDQGHLLHTPLCFGDVNAVVAKLSFRCQGVKISKIFSAMDLSSTLGRITCLYWPIFLGIQSIFAHPTKNFFEQLAKAKPQGAFLKNTEREVLEETLGRIYSHPMKEKEAKATWISSFLLEFFSHGAAKRKKRKFLGKALRLILATQPASESLQNLLDQAKIRWVEVSS